MWLYLGHFGRTDKPHTSQSVLDCPRLERSQTLRLVIIERDHELAALVEGYPASATVRPQLPSTGLAQRRP